MAAADRRRGIVLPIAVTILGLAAIGVVEDIPVRHSIEHKLTAASTDALAKAGVTVDGVSFTGRDGTVRVDSAAVGDRALAVVRHVDGVRVVHVVLTTGSDPPARHAHRAPSDSATPAPSVSLTVRSRPSRHGPSTAPVGTVSHVRRRPSAAPRHRRRQPAYARRRPRRRAGRPARRSPQVQAQLNALGDDHVRARQHHADQRATSRSSPGSPRSWRRIRTVAIRVAGQHRLDRLGRVQPDDEPDPGPGGRERAARARHRDQPDDDRRERRVEAAGTE